MKLRDITMRPSLEVPRAECVPRAIPNRGHTSPTRHTRINPDISFQVTGKDCGVFGDSPPSGVAESMHIMYGTCR